MKFMLDTHLLIWVVMEDRRLFAHTSDLITGAQNEIFSVF
jgi:PIN domain nuclease of toxin-antitoxin system